MEFTVAPVDPAAEIARVILENEMRESGKPQPLEIPPADEKPAPTEKPKEKPKTAFDAVRDNADPDAQLSITDIAKRHHLTDDDPLWAIVAALQLHHDYVAPLPDALSTASLAAAGVFQMRIDEMTEIIDKLPNSTRLVEKRIAAAAETGIFKAMEVATKKFKEDNSQLIIDVATKATTKELTAQVQKLTVSLTDQVKQIAADTADAKITAQKAYWAKMGLFVAAAVLIIGVASGFAMNHYLNRNSGVTISPDAAKFFACTKTDAGIFCGMKPR